MKMLRMKYLGIVLSLFITTVIFIGCEDKGTEALSGTEGALLVKMTDGPFPISAIAEANVTIDKIEIRRSEENEGYPFVTVFEDTITFNLLTLRNGITRDLPEVMLPAGSYNLVRLYVADASIVLNNGQEYNLKVPSGAETGIKIFIDPEVTVQGGLTAELLLDFDLSKSFEVQGDPETPAGINGFHFTPVIRAVNNTSTGRLVGTVEDTSSTPLENAHIWIEQDSVVANTYTNSDGSYALIGLYAGTYSAYATKEGYDTVFVADVEIISGNQTTQNFVLNPQ